MAAGRDVIDFFNAPAYPSSSDDDILPPAPPMREWPQPTQHVQQRNDVLPVNDSSMNHLPLQQEQMMEHGNPPPPGDPRRDRVPAVPGAIINGWHNCVPATTRTIAGAPRSTILVQQQGPDYPRAFDIMPQGVRHQMPSIIATVPQPTQMQQRTAVDIRNIIAFKRLQCYRTFRNRQAAFGYMQQRMSTLAARRRTEQNSIARNSILSSAGYPMESRRLRRAGTSPDGGSGQLLTAEGLNAGRTGERDMQLEPEYADEEDENIGQYQEAADVDNNQRLSPTLPAEDAPANNSDNDDVPDGDEEQRTLSPPPEEARSPAPPEETQNMEDDSGQESEEVSRSANNLEVLDITNEPETEAGAQSQVAVPVKRRRPHTGAQSLESFDMKDFQELLRLLECPVCLEWMEPPMWQCRRGHLVCGRCRGRLQACPVCRSPFSSVRNRAMENVAELLRYPCRHGCGRHAKLRRRAHHEASCVARRYRCPAPACAASAPLPLTPLSRHVKRYHAEILKTGSCHNFTVRLNAQQNEDWLLMVENCGLFHLKINVETRTFCLILYVVYIGPKCFAKDYVYEVTVLGQHNGRKLSYSRTTHSDLECSSQNVSRQDCFHLSLEQAVNYVRVRNRPCERDRTLDLTVAIAKLRDSAAPAPALDAQNPAAAGTETGVWY